MALDEYRRKRDFARTPEPAGNDSGEHQARSFVVQKHEASRLHWDFRLELGGTLRPDHTVVFFVNGNRRPAGSGLGLELQNLDRGSHFLRAAVLDRNGDPVITSQQITFHVREPSVNSPQSPQARPKPPPRRTH